jgi:nucleoid DNA-binding protein
MSAKRFTEFRTPENEFSYFQYGGHGLNKTELVTALAARTGQTKIKAAAFLEAFQDTVAEALKAKKEVALVGFGTFKVAEKKERTGRNPGTGEVITVPPSTVPVFKSGTRLKASVR